LVEGNIQHTFDADLLDGHRMVLLASQAETNHKEREDDDIKIEPIKLGSQLESKLESKYTHSRS
jgi:hypothetical protein